MRHFPALICVVTGVAVAQAAHLPMLRQSRHRSLPRDVGDIEDRGVVAINVASATAGRPPTVLVPSTTTVSSNSSVSTSAAPMAALPSGLPTDRVALAFGQASRSQARSEDAMTTTIIPVPSAVSKDNGQDAQGWVDAHNSFRSQYGAKDVVWDHDLSVKASNNAKKCNQQHSNAGENIAWKSGGTWTSMDVVSYWMSEAPLYTWDRPGYQEDWGHFTQVVWRNTAKVGCYIAQCGKGIQATCEYDPAGNYVDSFADNVKPKGTNIQ